MHPVRRWAPEDHQAAAVRSAESAPAIERNQATSSELVFNVNFSGAVIYDTKKAAEEALSNRVIQMMNSNRRGAPKNRRS